MAKESALLLSQTKSKFASANIYMDSYSYEPPPNRRQKESRMARKLSKALADKH
jgi:hypothetical protein